MKFAALATPVVVTVVLTASAVVVRSLVLRILRARARTRQRESAQRGATATAANLLAALFARLGERRTLAVGVTGLAQAIARAVVLTVGGLSNFFAGIRLLADKPIRVGDFVRLEREVEGFVEDIGWRSTRTRMLPEPGMSLLIPISVSHAAASFVDQYLAQHELRKRILKRFRADGIEIPFRTRTVERRGGPRP